MQRAINWKFLFLTAAAVLLVGVGVHLVHGLQVRQNAGKLLEQAERAKDSGDIGHAVLLYTHYLECRPDDVDAEARLALTLDARAKDDADRKRVAGMLEGILRRDPSRADLRQRLVVNLIQLVRLREAIANLQTLIPASPNKAELQHQLGWCQEAVGDYAKAAIAFRRAIALEPTRQASYVLLAETLRDHLDQADEAAQVMDGLVAANADSYLAYLARFKFARARVGAGQSAKSAQAEADLHKALELAPKEIDVLLAAADWERAKGDSAQADDLIRRAAAIAPHNHALIKARAGFALRAGKRAEAVDLLTAALKDNPGAVDLDVMLADLLIDDGKLSEAAARIGALSEAAGHTAPADYLRGRLAVAQGKWSEALVSLNKAQSSFGADTHWSSRLQALIGQCYHELGDFERELTAFRRAVALEPSWTPARFGLATALMDNGFLDEGITELNALRRAADAPPRALILLARALLARNMRLPEAQRHWDRLTKVLDEAPPSAEAVCLRAAVLAARHDYAGAKKLLDDAGGKQPQERVVWLARAELAARQQNWPAADALLDQAEKTIGAGADLALARIGIWGAAGTVDARRRLASLADHLDGLDAPGRTRVQRALASTWTRLGDNIRAAVLWRGISQEQPRDVSSRFALFEIAIQGNEFDKAAGLLDEMRNLEGDQGKYWRLGSAELALRRQADDPATLNRVRGELAQLARRQKSWQRVPLLRGAVEELAGNFDKAADYYKHAVELGARQARDVSRTLQLLMRFRRFLDAEQVWHTVAAETAPAPEILRLGAEIALGNQNAAEALRLADLAISSQSADYRDHLWLGRIYHATGADDKAETALRRALQLAPRTPDTWIALVRQLALTGQRPAAQAMTNEAKAKIGPSLALFTEARCLEAMGLTDRAAAAYRAGLAMQADDFVFLAHAADFFRRADLPLQAEPFLTALLNLPEVPAEYISRARRQLALVLAAKGGSGVVAALELVDANLRSHPKSVPDLRARAVIQAGEPGQRRQAIGVIEETARHLPLTADEQLALADLWSAAGDQARAGEQILAALTSDPDNAQIVAHYIRVLLADGDLDQAEAQLQNLNRLEPGSSRARQLERKISQAADNALP